MMMLLGITQPTACEIWLFGKYYAPNRLELRNHIGIIPEKNQIGGPAVDDCTRASNAFRLHVRGALTSEAQRQAPRESGPAAYGEQTPRKFSRGMLQKLSITHALLPDSDILFLDEPILGLDPLEIRQVRDLIFRRTGKEGRSLYPAIGYPPSSAASSRWRTRCAASSRA